MGTWPTPPTDHIAQHRARRAKATKTRLYRQMVARIADIALRRTDVPIQIAEFCTAAAVSQRTLRTAFQAVHGTTPHRYLRALRMRAARSALLSPHGANVTVTQIATRFGFFELGRFAVEYRLAFGESPSATLRRACAVTRELPMRRADASTMQSGYAPS
jgi:AraC-like DNA-binding protein